MDFLTKADLAEILKSQPSIQESHANVPLTNMAVAYMQDRENFVASSAFPRCPVPMMTGTYWEFPRGSFFSSQAKKRAPGAIAARSGYTVTTGTYSLDRDALGHGIPDPLRRNWNNPADPDTAGAEFLGQQMLLAREIDFASKYFTTGVWTTNGTQGAGAWELAASTPIEDLKGSQRTLLGLTGLEGNTLLLGKKCFDNLCDHPDVIDRIKFGAGPGNPAMFNERGLAQIFGIERVIVAKATNQTAGEGQAAVYAMVLGTRNALLVHTAPNPGIMVPSAGYAFTWGGSGNDMGVEVKRYRDEPHESDILESGQWYQHKVIAADLGVFYSNAVAA